MQLRAPSQSVPANAWVQIGGQLQPVVLSQVSLQPPQPPPNPSDEQTQISTESQAPAPAPAPVQQQPQLPPGTRKKSAGGRIGGRGHGCHDYGYRICTQIMIYANRHKMGNQDLSRMLGIPASSAGSIYLRFKKLANSRDLDVQLDTVDRHFNINPKAHRPGRPKGIPEPDKRVRGVRKKKVTAPANAATPATTASTE